MPDERSPRAGLAARRRGVRSEPLCFVALMVVVDAIAGFWIVRIIAAADLSGDERLLAVFLLVTAIVFEEAVASATRLQLRLSATLKRDMVSVWTVAAAAALPDVSTLILLSGLLTYTWFRQQRPTGRPPHRMVFNVANVLVSALTAAAAANAIRAADGGALSVAFSVLVAMAVYALMNRAIVTAALLTLGAPGRELVGGKDENLMELATLALGALVAVTVIYEPVLTLLVIAPMVGLQRGSLVRELEQLAMTDAKTGLLTAAAWEQLAQRELARAERDDYSMAVLIVDIDRFKEVNDRFGHLIGDRVLERVGKTIKSSLREYDGCGRFGGEEFVAVLPEIDEPTAVQVAERIRAEVGALTVGSVIDDPAAACTSVTVSVGVSLSPTDGKELSDLLLAADQALFSAKAAGRNRVRLARRDDGVDERVTV